MAWRAWNCATAAASPSSYTAPVAADVAPPFCAGAAAGAGTEIPSASRRARSAAIRSGESDWPRLSGLPAGIAFQPPFATISR